MSIVKAHRFPVAVEWRGDRVACASVRGKQPLEVATSPEFRGTHPELWSPEDLLVAALASCYAVTLVSLAEWRGIPLRGLSVDGLGHVERREDGRFAFVAIDLQVKVETDEATLAAAEEAARETKEACLVSIALDAPVHLELEISARTGAAA